MLRTLRAPGERGYKIPRGGLYRFVSAPNYFGELVEWSGFALAAWSPAALVFVVWTAANLAPRAWANHRWYRRTFPDYPPEPPRARALPLLGAIIVGDPCVAPHSSIAAYPAVGRGCKRVTRPAAAASTERSAMRATQKPGESTAPARPLKRCFEEDASGDPPRPLEALLDRAAERYDHGDFQTSLVCAEEAARVEPRSVEAHHDRAAALQEIGRLDEAESAFTRALALDPDDPETLAGAADLYINRLPPTNDHTETGLEFARRGSRRLKRVHAPHGARPDRALVARLALLEGQALNDLGRSREALMRLDAALAAVPDDSHARYERAVALFDLCRFAEAKRAFNDVLAKNPHDAWAHHHLGLTLERLGDVASADRELARARMEAPAEFHSPVEVSAAEFRALVDNEAKKLSPELRADLGRVALETVGPARPQRSHRRGAAAGADHPRPLPRRAHRRSAGSGGARHRHLSQEPRARGRVARRADPADPHHAAARARPPARRGRRRLARARARMSAEKAVGTVSRPPSAPRSSSSSASRRKKSPRSASSARCSARRSISIACSWCCSRR